MLLNDALGVGGCDVLIPGAFWIDHRDRAGGADAEAGALAAKARAVRAGNVQGLHALFQILPRRLTNACINTIRADADKQMAGELANAECLCDQRRGDLIGVGHIRNECSGFIDVISTDKASGYAETTAS